MLKQRTLTKMEEKMTAFETTVLKEDVQKMIMRQNWSMIKRTTNVPGRNQMIIDASWILKRKLKQLSFDFRRYFLPIRGK